MSTFFIQHHTDTEYDSRIQAITDTLESAGSAIEGFDDDMVRQMFSSITVLDKDRLRIRFKDGTEIEQIIVSVSGRAGA